MLFKIPLGWLQLRAQKLRMGVALSGVAFAAILIFMQLGFRAALFDSAVRYHRALHYDIALISPDTNYIVNPQDFSRRRLYQAASLPGVSSVSALYMSLAPWVNPQDHSSRPIFVIAFDPSDGVLDLEAVNANRDRIRLPDVFLFDRASRAEFGPVAEWVEAGAAVETELAHRRIRIGALFEMGTSFGIDGTLLTSDLNFLRLFPDRPAGSINLGLIRLEPGRDPSAARDAIDAALEDDVLVLTKEQYAAREIAFWNSTTPIGYVFAFGVIVGLVVGAIIVYQILFADVSDHLPEYATLRAMGYPMFFLVGVVLQEAAILAVLGYLPGLVISAGLYHTAAEATKLPLLMTAPRALLVLALTVIMCAVAGITALRKVWRLDPAEVF